MTTILHKAFDQGNYHKLYVLLELPVKVDIQDSGGRTLLMKASWIPKISEGQTLAKALLHRGANRATLDTRGWSALFHAVYNNRIGIAKCLLAELDLDLQHKDTEGLTVLHIAALQGHTELARGLVSVHKKCHVDVDTVDNQGMTALHTACARGHYEIAKLLVYKGNATQTKRDNMCFKSPAEWLKMTLAVHTDIDLFPPQLQKTRDWYMYSLPSKGTNNREPVKTAPNLTIPKPEQIRLAFSPITPRVEVKRRCKSATISRSHNPVVMNPVKNKTFMLTSPSLLPQQRTSTAKPEKRSIQRLRSAPPKLSSHNRNNSSSRISIHSSLHRLITRENSCPGEQQHHHHQKNKNIQTANNDTPSQQQVLKHIFDVYTLQESGSYRKEAIPPPPPVLSLSDLNCSNLSLDDCSSTARPLSADRKSCSSGKARFQKVVRMRRTESILKSLKAMHGGKRNSLSGSMTSVNDVTG